MPLYSFKCVRCDHDFEALQPINMRNMAECPKCGGDGTAMITAPGNYTIKGDNGASQRPKAGLVRRKK